MKTLSVKKVIGMSMLGCLAFWSLSCSKAPIQSVKDPDPKFCEFWNPDFTFNKHHCCRLVDGIKRKGSKRCTPKRRTPSFCQEMTPEQSEYISHVNKGKIDVLTDIQDVARMDQAFCSVNDGFLAHGRAIVPTANNRLELFFPGRCTNFGTDLMVALLEWTGREVGKQYSLLAYSGVRLLIADVAAPRGGCIWGLSGSTAHLSHTTGQDADIGFLTITKFKNSPVNLSRQFDAKVNWWLIKKIFHNPYVCVKNLFLDQVHIHSLAHLAKKTKDPEWKALSPYIKHVLGHHNHFHVRIGSGPGKPGCFIQNSEEHDLDLEDEFEEGSD